MATAPSTAIPAYSGRNRTWGVGHELRAISALWLRDFKIFQREKSRVISAIASPLLWLFFLGQGLGTIIPAAVLKGLSYEQYIFPGVVAQVVLFGTVFHGLYIIWDRKLDVLKEVLAAPVSRTTIFFGKVLGGTTEAVLQTLIVLLIGIVLVGVPPLGVVEGLAVIILLAIGFDSIGLSIGSLFESFEGFQAITTFLIFPLFFLSGAIYPLSQLPPYLEWPTIFNPASYAVDALRGLLVGGQMAFPLWVDFGVLVAFDALAILVGTTLFRRMK